MQRQLVAGDVAIGEQRTSARTSRAACRLPATHAPATSAPSRSRSRPHRPRISGFPSAASTSSRSSNGPLEFWDTTGFDGLYTLRLVVMEHSGNVLTYESPIVVDNNAEHRYVENPSPGSALLHGDSRLVS